VKVVVCCEEILSENKMSVSRQTHVIEFFVIVKQSCLATCIGGHWMEMLTPYDLPSVVEKGSSP
jgi:hypothetical protein